MSTQTFTRSNGETVEIEVKFSVQSRRASARQRVWRDWSGPMAQKGRALKHAAEAEREEGESRVIMVPANDADRFALLHVPMDQRIVK